VVLREVLAGVTRKTSPFVDEVPKLDALGTTWVEPVLVVDIESLGPSAQGRIRQPSYIGTRADLTPEDLT
jgi:bifunctional non-homologous end joining protein LigD